MKYFAMREYGIAPDGWVHFDGRWVVRDAAFNYVDHDKYRHDMAARYEGLVIVDRERG